jgi:ribosomal protein L32E
MTHLIFLLIVGLLVALYLFYKAGALWSKYADEQRQRREQAMKEVVLGRATLLNRRDFYRYALTLDHRELSRESEIRARVRRELEAIDLKAVEDFYPGELKNVLMASVQDLELLKVLKQVVARKGWLALELKRLTEQAQLDRIKKLLELPPPQTKEVEVSEPKEQSHVVETIDPEERLRAEVEDSVGRRLKWEIYAQMIRSQASEQLLQELRKREREIDRSPLSDEDKQRLKERLVKDFEYTLRKIQAGS